MHRPRTTAVAPLAGTFYQDRSVHVDSAALYVGDRIYPLGDLEQVWHRRGSVGTTGAMVRSTPLLVFLGIIGALAGGAVLLRHLPLSAYNGAVLLAGAVIGVLLLGVLGLFAVDSLLGLVERSQQYGGAVHQIWARYHGHEVMLFATRDRLRFGKVYRALQRAIEYQAG
jgi:hypothetical protein